MKSVLLQICDDAAMTARLEAVIELILTLGALSVPRTRALLEVAHRLRASCLVMGACGHSRFRERLVGGEAHKVAAAAALPLLVAY